ncbi:MULTISPECIES: hypothetical protein [Flammeovirga]|uniref:Por secretion system C-terminal sorting domain-containing protein n=1 Tax=Flammeovirga agarivorans TaxID=2726742 RepID=A0A7X8XUF4_9BACT|nr:MULTISPECIES: hypothetical protein [Flammeovirga]NLR90199.1 hypothetical protein [Flammeovirga agarivorans]
MKKLTLLMLTCICMLGNVAYAQSEINFSLTPKRSSIVIDVDEIYSKSITYHLIDSNKVEVEAKNLTEKGKKVLNFKEVPEGNYELELLFENKKIVKQIRVAPNKKISFISNKWEALNAGFVINIRGKKMEVRTNNNLEEEFEIIFRDMIGKEVYREHFTGGMNNVMNVDLSSFGTTMFMMDLEVGDALYSDIVSTTK